MQFQPTYSNLLKSNIGFVHKHYKKFGEKLQQKERKKGTGNYGEKK